MTLSGTNSLEATPKLTHPWRPGGGRRRSLGASPSATPTTPPSQGAQTLAAKSQGTASAISTSLPRPAAPTIPTLGSRTATRPALALALALALPPALALAPVLTNALARCGDSATSLDPRRPSPADLGAIACGGCWRSTWHLALPISDIVSRRRCCPIRTPLANPLRAQRWLWRRRLSPTHADTLQALRELSVSEPKGHV